MGLYSLIQFYGANTPDILMDKFIHRLAKDGFVCRYNGNRYIIGRGIKK
jgi:hypothetical protein